MLDQNYLDTAHLLRRAGFGAGPEEVRAAASRGLAAATDDLLHPERIPDPINDAQIMQRLTALIPEDRRTNKNGTEYLPLQVIKMWWTIRMLVLAAPAGREDDPLLARPLHQQGRRYGGRLHAAAKPDCSGRTPWATSAP